jgi:hypothetical protein
MGRLGATTGNGEVCEIPLRIACMGVLGFAQYNQVFPFWLLGGLVWSVGVGCSFWLVSARGFCFGRCTQGVFLVGGRGVCFGGWASGSLFVGGCWVLFGRCAWVFWFSLVGAGVLVRLVGLECFGCGRFPRSSLGTGFAAGATLRGLTWSYECRVGTGCLDELPGPGDTGRRSTLARRSRREPID